MGLKLSNNATSTLAASISSSATSLSVEVSHAERFPSLGQNDWFPLTVVDGNGNMEIMLATDRNGAIITVQRGQENTTAKSFSAGARIDLRLTAGAYPRVADTAIYAAVTKSNPAVSDLFGLLDSAAGFVMKKMTWGNILAVLGSHFFSVSAGAALQADKLGVNETAVNALNADYAVEAGTAVNADYAVTADNAVNADYAVNAGKLENLPASAFVRSNANDTMSGTYTVTGSFTVRGNLFIGKHGGGDSWAYFHDDNSNLWRALGWDDSENAFVAEQDVGGRRKLALVFGGPNVNETNFPIGHPVCFATPQNYVPLVVRNSSQTIRLGGSALNYQNYGNGAILAGTYRARGRCEDEGSVQWFLAQRVA